MKIKRFATKNWMGAPDCTIDPGTLTIVSGRNGSGKTSLIEALRYCIGSGHDPSAVKVGQEAATVEILTDDGTTIKTRVTAKGTTRTITDSQGRKITRSAEWINSVINSLTLDPIRFLDQTPKEQTASILAAIPLRITAKDLEFMPLSALKDPDLDRHALTVLADIRADLYEQRTGCNRIAKEKRATASQMTQTLPPDAPSGKNWDDEFKRLFSENKRLNEDLKSRSDAIRADAATAIESQYGIFQAQKDGVLEELAAELDRRRKEFEEGVKKITADSQIEIGRCEALRDKAITEAGHHRDEGLGAVESELRPQINQVLADGREAKGMLEQSAKAETTRQFIASQNAEAQTMEAKSEALTTAINKIEALKTRLASELPIPGLEITADGLTLDGVPFQRVNLAKQFMVSMSVGKLQAGEFGLMLADNIEHLDAKSRAAFKEGAQLCGLQVIAACVDDAELKVINE